MLDFANPYLLLLLLAVPLIWGLYKLARLSRRRKLKRLGNPKLLVSLMPEASRYKSGIKIPFQTPTTIDFPAFFPKSNFLSWQMNSTLIIFSIFSFYLN